MSTVAEISHQMDIEFNQGILSDTPQVIETCYNAIKVSDIEALEKLDDEGKLPGLFDYYLEGCSCGCAIRYNISNAIRDSKKISPEVMAFLLEKVIPVKYHGIIMLQILNECCLSVADTTAWACEVVRVFKPENVLVTPGIIESIVKTFPIGDKTIDGDVYDVTNACRLLEILEEMFPNEDLYSKLDDDSKKIVARVDGKYVDIRK
jgi:hypothetical protein